MEPIDVIRPSGTYRSQDREVVPDVTGTPVVDLGQAPGLLVRRVLRELGDAAGQPAKERLEAIAAAGAVFATAEIDGETPARYCRAMARVSGLPLTTTLRGLDIVARAAANISATCEAQRPRGAAASRHEATGGGCAVWAPRGRVLAVHAPGNHPGPHTEWLAALGLGYRVAVRPSRRDPFTPRRLARALLANGLDPGHFALLPTSHEVSDTLVRSADLAVVYGADEVVRRYAHDGQVLAQGPGRSKILITEDIDWRDHLDLLAESVAGDGGTACINTSVILVEGDPRPLAEALASRLDSLQATPPEDPDAALPVRPISQAQAITGWVYAQTDGAATISAGPRVGDLGDGSAALRPAVFLLDDPRRPQTAIEMPFPCVWVAPWSRAAGIDPLRRSLVLTLLTGDEAVVDACVSEPSIRNIHWGDHATNWVSPGLPHDGYLGQFLMEAKTFTH